MRRSPLWHAKVDSAAQSLAAINPHCQLHPVNGQLDDAALLALIARQQVVLDCTDNVAVREQLNRLCRQQRVQLRVCSPNRRLMQR